MKRAYRSALAGTFAIAAVIGAPDPALALDMPPRTNYFDRLNEEGSMADRIRDAYVRQGEALARCDLAGAQAALEELERLVRQARAAAQAARAAGDLSTINPDDAMEDHNIGIGHLHYARTRQAAGCPAPQQPAGRVSTPEPRHRMVEEAAVQLEAARSAAAGCDVATLDAAIRRLDDLYLDASSNFDWHQTTWRDWEAIQDMLEQARRLRAQCSGTPPQTSFTLPRLETRFAAADPAPIIGGGIFVTWLDIPRFDIGFQRDNVPDAQERPAGSSGENVTQVGGAIDVRIPLSDDFGLNLGFGYADGNVSSVFHVPPGHPSGIVYRDLSEGGSSGISASDGVDGSIHSASRAFVYNFGADFMPVRDIRFRGNSNRAVRAQNAIDLFSPSRVTFDLFVEDQETRHEATLRGEGSVGTFNYFFQHDSDQQVDEVRAGLEIGAGLGLRSGDVFAEFFAAGGPYMRWSDGTFVDRYQANFGPAPDRDFTTRLTDEDDGVGFRGRAAVSAGVQLSSNVVFSVDGQAQVRTQVGRIINPTSGNQVFFDGERVRLGTESAWTWSLGATLTVRLP